MGSVVSSAFASACCLGPLILSLLGISGAAVAHRFEPLRPYLLVLTYALLGGAAYLTYRPARPECGPGQACAMPRDGRVARAMLWVTAVVVLLATLFPFYSRYLFSD